MPFLFLLLIFLAIYAELAVIIAVGESIGAFATLFAMIATAAAGLALVRLQGFGVYRKMNESMARGETPVEEMMHGVLLLFSGFLLIIPGFISDGVGALLLIPPIRSFLISKGVMKQTRKFYTWRRQGGVTIEGEYSKPEDEDDGRPQIGKNGDQR